MTAMLPLMRVLEQGGKFVQSIKHGLEIRGVPAGPPRKPLQSLNKDEKRDLAQVIRVMDSTLAHIAGGKAGKKIIRQRTWQGHDDGPLILAAGEGNNHV